MKTKTQKQAEERAPKKTAAQEVKPEAVAEQKQPEAEQKPAEQPKPATQTASPTPATAAAVVTKQQTTIGNLIQGWTERGVDLSKLSIKDDGKFKLVIVDEGWPTVQVGNSGGITVLELKSYTKAFDAALIGKELYDKQKGREQKKATAAAPAPKAEAKAPEAEKQLQTA